MLTSISEEMKKNDMGTGDPFKNIMSIAESVAGKMKPSIEKNGIDISQLISSTQVFANQCTDKNGKPMFDVKMNPFALLSKMAGGNPEISEEQCLDQCNEMLQKMGIDPNMLNNQFGGQMPAQRQPKKKGGKRKKRN